MNLSQSELTTYHEDGVILLVAHVNPQEIKLIIDEIEILVNKKVDGLLLESDNTTLRALHGCHLCSELFANLIRLPRFVELAKEIIGSDVYLHQFKINTKKGYKGDVWPWHQDYSYWKKEDGMPSPRALNIVIFLNDVNEFNGPLCFIPQSQGLGLLDIERPDKQADDVPKWQENVSAKLKYILPNEKVSELVDQYGIVAPKGTAGSAVIFHSSIVHGSVPNISPYDRNLLVLTYNSVENKLAHSTHIRPEFLVGRDYSAIIPINDDALLSGVREFEKGARASGI